MHYVVALPQSLCLSLDLPDLLLMLRKRMKGPRGLLVNVVCLLVGGKLASPDICEKVLQGFGGCIGQVRVLPHKFWWLYIVEAQYIVKHKHLAIAVWAGPNANRWNRYFFRHDFCQDIGNAL